MILRFFAKLVDIASWAISSLILIRFIMRFFGASTQAPFVVWLYDLTGNLMRPFAGIFPTPALTQASVLDIPALIAAIIYAGAGYLISTLIVSLAENLRLATGENRPPEGRQSSIGANS